MKIIIIFVLFFMPFYLFSQELKCSFSGTTIYTVNGVQNNDDDATKFQNTVDAKIIKSMIDEKPLVDVRKIFNPSNGLTNDALELLAQDLRARGITDNPWKYFGAALTGVESTIPLAEVAKLVINVKTLSTLKEDVNRAMYSPEQLQKADERVVQGLKGAVKGSLDSKKKVIVVAHSQGNSVTNLAMTHLMSDAKFNKDYMPYLGVLHVATPVNWRAIANSQLIKISSDLVVWNLLMQPISESANYHLVGYHNYSPISNTFLRILFSNDKDYMHHGMVETYLNDQYFAHPIGMDTNRKNMVEIFNEKMHQVALNLESNCGEPIIKIKSPLIERDFLNQLNKIDTYAGSNVDLTIFDDNPNYDTSKTIFNWEIRTVGAENKFPTVHGDTSIVPIYLPYNDLLYEVKVYATNEAGEESSAIFNFLVKNNRPPSLSASGVTCSMNSLGYADGSGTALITVKDDSFALNGNAYNLIVPYKAENYSTTITDGFGATATATVTNTCEKTPLRYEVWGYCILGQVGENCNLPVGIRDPKCEQISQTGAQYNELRIYSHGTSEYSTLALGSGENGIGYFTDPNDSSKMITFPSNGLCTYGTEAPNGEQPWIQIQ